MKYRRNKVKREHGIIQDALTWLEELSRYPEVSDIIPGVIEVSRSPERGIVYKYETHTGCRILLKSNGSIQEAFVVTKNPEIVRQWVNSRFPSFLAKRSSVGIGKSESRSNKEDKGEKSSVAKSAVQGFNPCGSNVKTSNSKSKRGKNKSLKGKRLEDKYLDLKENLDSPSLGQRINSKTRQALRALQKDLNQSNLRMKK